MANEHVAISTQGVQLLRGDSKTTLKELCWIQEYPDLIEDPDTIDVTTLMHTMQANIPALPKSSARAFPAFVDTDAGNLKSVQDTANTKNVNTYYFAEIAVDADRDGNIYECRKRGFESLESNPDFLQNTVRKGSYGEDWSLRKVLRRFIWHDRIHARAMYRMAIKVFGAESIVNPFYFFDEGVLT